MEVTIFLHNWFYTGLTSVSVTFFTVNNFLLLYYNLLKNKQRHCFKRKMQNTIVNLKALPTFVFVITQPKKAQNSWLKKWSWKKLMLVSLCNLKLLLFNYNPNKSFLKHHLNEIEAQLEIFCRKFEHLLIITLWEKCLNTDQKKLRIWKLFTQCQWF